ncbi:OX-2 membrane glycoprotein-like [Kryptolebias marmoratus]|uniref:OX-2 membrane glycoprotein-like n=1 Tax=Kryptolebias marmoratus TaxID=37003 RepID=UPI0018AD010B|nr:OX-2 membrane glycoprotein-like [Kryptolebias marmoratus]
MCENTCIVRPNAAAPFLAGATGPIQTQRTVWTAAGEDAHLSCQLLETKDVHQVTWQKIFKDKKENVGSYDKYFGETVNPGFEGKVEFKQVGLQNTSIVIRNVSEQDEGCYYCLFNADPEGALKGETCLHVYELHGPVLHVREPDSPEESVVSCSATGRPAPTVTLTVTQQHLHFSQHNTVRVTNTNNTVTVTTTAVLSGLHDDSTQVGCAARVDSGPQMEVMKRISELKQTSDDDLEKKSKLDQDHNRWFLFGPICLMVAVCLCVAVVIFVRRRNNSSRSDLQTNGLSEITTIDPQRTEGATAPRNDQLTVNYAENTNG